MSALDAVKPYFDAWNRRSPEGIVAAIKPGGTYQDPMTGGPLVGPAIAQYSGALFEAFPDLSFEIISEAETGPGSVAAQWMMRGTNTGPMQGAPPTGKAIALAGADFIEVSGDKVAAVKGYFDTAEVPRQLGMQIIVQPDAIGPVQFGTSVYMSLGKRTPPGAFSITSLRIRTEDEAGKVRSYSQRIMQEMPQMKGFISAVTGQAGSHMFTITAWESPDDIRQMRGGAHQDAMAAFFGPDFTHGGTTNVWTPHRLNPVWVRCSECGEMSATQDKDSKCRCGQALPEPPPYW
jgi:steroid delta-isomerase-like uncharacterized protein